ncbi:MAG TPA: YncE family protein [Candidatus Limnocylindrales bacterium]
MDSFTTTDIPVGESPRRLAIAPDGARLYVTHGLHASDGSISDLAKTVSVIDTSTDTVIDQIPLDAEPHGIAVSPDGALLFVSHIFADTVSVIETLSNAVVATVPITGNPDLLGVTGDGSRVYVTHSGQISVIDVTTYTVASVIDSYPAGFTGMAVASDGGRIYAAIGPSGPTNGGLLVVDPMASPPTAVRMIELRSPTSVAMSADGSRCYVIDQGEPTSFKDDLVVVDTPTDAVRRVGFDTTLEGIAPDPTGYRVYVSNGVAPATVSVLEATTDTFLTSFPLDGQADDMAVTSPDATTRHIYVSIGPLDKVSHTVSVASFASGELLSYDDAGTPGNVSDPVTVGFGGWQAFSHLFAGRNAAGQDRIYVVVA